MSNGSPGPLTLPPKRPNTADLILRAASRVIVERRSLDVNVADLADESGVSKALIRYHFDWPTGLLRALTVRDAAEMATAVRVVLGERVTAATIEQPLAEIVRLHLARPYGPALLRHAVEAGWSDLAAGGAPPPRGGRRAHPHPAAAPRRPPGGAAGGPPPAAPAARPAFGALREIAKQGEALGAFRRVDPLLLYGEVVAACDALFLGDALLAVVAADIGAERPTPDQLSSHLIERMLTGVRRTR